MVLRLLLAVALLLPAGSAPPLAAVIDATPARYVEAKDLIMPDDRCDYREYPSIIDAGATLADKTRLERVAPADCHS